MVAFVTLKSLFVTETVFLPVGWTFFLALYPKFPSCQFFYLLDFLPGPCYYLIWNITWLVMGESFWNYTLTLLVKRANLY
uniref:Uncharacterized protein n=1 Tax=Manihot esculenta TaxID=3983 RepID=A0A2C9UJL5_MANES